MVTLHRSIEQLHRELVVICTMIESMLSDAVRSLSESVSVLDDIRKLADVFWQVLNGFKVDPVMELEDWASSEKVLTGVAVELLSVRSLLFRMLRAGFPEGYHDMQSVVIDLWELGVVSFPSKQNTRRATTT